MHIGRLRDQRKRGVARLSVDLAVAVYRLTGSFPASERCGLTDQMRRAAVSVGSNIAKGAGRSGDKKFLRFVNIAYGCASELTFQLTIASELGVAPKVAGDSVAESIDHLQRMLNRLAKRLKSGRTAEASARE